MSKMQINDTQLFFKRVFDVVLSLILLPITILPILILIILASMDTKAFGLFWQERIGQHAKPFMIYKIRTLKVEPHILGDLDRSASWFGRFLRRSKWDELPQLINVLKGDMSLIGPRPLLIRYLPHYNDVQKKRHDIKPGITGWAQVNGRNNLNWEQKFAYDVYYVENMSLLLDIKIVFMTIYKIFAKKGIYDQDNGIGPEFTGSDN